tara:strand:- start:128 stop:625 length:498 start_codon:yes stop_codon:yes gene_type:complete
MTMMLKAIYAMNKKPGCTNTEKTTELNIDKKDVKISRKETVAMCEMQLSTIVKMTIDGYGIKEITNATGVKRCFISATRKRFGLLRPKLDDERAKIKKILMESPDFTHKVASISKLTGYRSDKVSKILAKIPQAERGTEEGLKYNYKYNFDIKLGAGATGCGMVY